MSQIDPTERFAEIFCAAFDRAHRRTDGADRASERVRYRVMRDIARVKERSETADPSAFGPDCVSRPSVVVAERRSDMEMVLGTPLTTNSRPRSQWWSLLVAGIAVVLVAATLRMTLPPTAPGSDNGNLAMVASPQATSMAPSRIYREATPTADACTAEPLTADQVLNIVRNPVTGADWLHRDSDSEEIQSEDLRYAELERAVYPHELIDQMMDIPTNIDDFPVEEAKAATQQFWDCMLYGTSYQVWGLMDPSFVQMEILAFHPVFRTEEDVMATITKIGPNPYFANGNSVFTALGAKDVNRLRLQTQPGDEGIWTMSTDAYFKDKIAIVALVPVNTDEALDPRPRHFLMQKFENGQWIVMGVDWQMNRP